MFQMLDLIHYRFRFDQGAQILERGQFVQRAKIQIVKEYARCRIKRGATRDLAMPYLVDPTSRLERFDDPARNDDTAYVFDITSRYRLAIGDDRQRFQDGAGILWWTLGIQAIQKLLIFRTNLKAPSAGDIGEFHAFLSPVRTQFLQNTAQHIGSDFLVEELPEVGDKQKFCAGKQRSLQHTHDMKGVRQRQVHDLTLRRWAKTHPAG